MIDLFPQQIPNYERLREILKTSRFAINLSELGSGKSIIALKLANDFERIIVISYPAVINQNWKPLLEKYKISAETITINALRGRKNYALNNSFLERDGDRYAATDLWKQIAGMRTLLIIDEFQMTKNKNVSARAVREMISYIGGSSRVLLMSGTPVDQPDQILNYLKMLGMVSKKRKYADLAEITGDESVNCFNFDQKLAAYFRDVFLPKYSDRMAPSPRNLVGFLGYIQLTGTAQIDAGEAVKSLENLCSKDRLETSDNCSIKTHLQRIELLKIPFLGKNIRASLQQKKKVVVALFYLDSILALARELRDLKPRVIIGETKNSERDEIISRFQEPTHRCRLIIANADIISTGINLDDAHGNFPRICFLASNYKSMISHQLFYRFSRITTKSPSEIVVLFCRNLNEDRVLKILAQKTRVLKDFSSSSIYFDDFKPIDL